MFRMQGEDIPGGPERALRSKGFGTLPLILARHHHAKEGKRLLSAHVKT